MPEKPSETATGAPAEETTEAETHVPEEKGFDWKWVWIPLAIAAVLAAAAIVAVVLRKRKK